MIPPLALDPEPLFRSLAEAVERVESGAITCRDLVSCCLQRIEKLEPLVQAWVLVDSEGSLLAAGQADERRRAGRPLSRLDGFPFGVKDIIDVAGWPTVAGFEPWNARIASRDAAIVAEMRRAGMIPIGKTVTTQFASIDPPRTRNPWNLDHTPGGSSSGSCAAVACRMVPLALGSQTGGSINRPASFCGVTGLKLAFGEWPVDGVVPCAERLDTLGPIVPGPKDLPLVFDAIFPRDSISDPAADTRPIAKRSILRLEGRFRTLADPAMSDTVAAVAERLTASGHEVGTDAEAPFFDTELWETHRIVMMSQCFWTHRNWFAEHPHHYAPRIRSWIESGSELLRTSPSRVRAAELEQDRLATEVLNLYGDYDALLVPAARGPAPLPETTGDPVMNAPWTLLGLPSLTVAVALDANGFPLGVQLVATKRDRNAIDKLVEIANDIYEDD